MTLKQVFIRNLKAYRKEEKISQMKLAMECDMALNYIGEIEMGRHFPSMEAVEKIAAVLHIKPYELFMDEIETPREKRKDTRDYLDELPNRIRTEITARLAARMEGLLKDSLRVCIDEAFDPKNY